MNVNDLVQFGLKGNSAASDVNFIKKNADVAEALCTFFNLTVEDGQPKIQAAQYAVNESYRNNGDDAVTVETIAATVQSKMETYRSKLRKLVAPVVTPEVVETPVEVVVPVEAAEVPSGEVAAEATVELTEFDPAANVPNETPVVKRGRGRPRKDPNAPVVAKVAKNPGSGKGRPKLAAGLSQYDRVVTWVNGSKFVGIVDKDRNAAALACAVETSIPVGSILVYFSKGIKAGLFS
jgi:hypothetical protein